MQQTKNQKEKQKQWKLKESNPGGQEGPGGLEPAVQCQQGKMSGRAQLNSHVQRLSRFLDNATVRGRDWYKPVARLLLERIVQAGQEVRLVVDGPKVGFGHQLLLVVVC